MSDPEVERLIWAVTDPAGPRREGDRVRPSAFPTASTDQLSRRRELGLAPVELTVQLAAAQLREDLADLRRLPDAELRQVGAAYLEPHVAQPLEVLAQRLLVGQRERESGASGAEGSASATISAGSGASPRRRSTSRGPTVTAQAIRSASRRCTFSRWSHS